MLVCATADCTSAESLVRHPTSATSTTATITPLFNAFFICCLLAASSLQRTGDLRI
jgi:hypothetical protein